MKRLQDKIAVVTGAASGLGKAIVECFADEGAKVIVADIADTGQAVADAIGGTFIRVDVADPASVERLIQTTVARHGKLDILVNNAGITGKQASIAESSVDNWRRVLSVNLDGVYYGLKFGLPVLSDGGAVLNMSSVCGMVAFENIAAYNASKAGVLHLTRTAAVEYASRRIRVNALCPTLAITPMVEQFIESAKDPEAFRQNLELLNPLRGTPRPEEIARAALFLVSDDARFITGVALPIDGGYTAR